MRVRRLTFVEGNFITPMILGRNFTISPLLIIPSMIFWGWVWGIIGLFLAVPLLMLFTILWENISTASLKRRIPVALNHSTSSG